MPAVFFLLWLVVFAAPSALARSWHIANFQDTIQINEDGSALVTEQIACAFQGEFHGIHRRIPFQYPGGHGENYTLYLKFIKVTDDQGNDLKYDTATKGAYRQLTIYIPGAVDATRTVNITYRVRNGIRYFDDYDEFYWNVTGNDWGVPIDHAGAMVEFPAKAQGGLRAQAYTGAYGATERANASINNTTANFETTQGLDPGGGLTVDVYIPKGVLSAPSTATKIGWFLGSNPILFLPLFSLVVMYTIWYRHGRDPDPGQSVAPMYAPPDGMTPAEAGALLGNQVHPRDISSTVVDLAVKGYITIEQTGNTGLGLLNYVFHQSDYIFHLQKPSSEWSKLASHEQSLLSELFPGGAQNESCALSSLRNHFYVALPGIRSSIMAELREKGMYGLDPSSAGGWDLFGGVIIAAPFVILQWAGLVDFGVSGWLVPVSVVAAVAIAIFFFRIMPAKSMLGAKTVVSIRGFQEFMNRVDKDRLRTMPPNTFEKYLPYAMALGVEQHWAHAFDGLAQQPPAWYTGPNVGVFNPILFTSNMNTMAQATTATFASAPRASAGGSGFGGGGGFSGGGFGGGGGDAF